jgi:hypothetical protein
MLAAALYHENAKSCGYDLHPRYMEPGRRGAANVAAAPYWCGCGKRVRPKPRRRWLARLAWRVHGLRRAWPGTA